MYIDCGRICTHLIVYEGDATARMYLGNGSDYESMMMGKVWEVSHATPGEVSPNETVKPGDSHLPLRSIAGELHKGDCHFFS